MQLALPALVLAGFLARAACQPAPSAPAQPAPTQPTTPAPSSAPAPPGQPAPHNADAPQTQETKFESLPPAMKLGLRAEALRRAIPSLPVLVLVPDDASYVRALAGWSIKARYPILIEDGTDAAREDIARFARAFAPKRIVRWSSGTSLPPPGPERRATLDAAVFSAWGGTMENEATPPTMTSWPELLTRFQALKLPPPGIILADDADPAWAAAIALAAGRAQPITWTTSRGDGINAVLSWADFESLSREAEDAAARTGIDWRGLGDWLDAVTLCGNWPAKVGGHEGLLATTDVLARFAPTQDSPRRDRGARWAFAGQVFAPSTASAAYRAMCGLFLGTPKAWLFDGYPDAPPWDAFDATKAAAPLREAKLEVDVEDSPRQGERQWRLSSSWGIDAGLIAVNTKGSADEFTLEPGQCRPGDVPFLNVPAILYFVHSFSASVPAERGTVAGRWLERGAYAYFGSVHEPFLGAFVPTPLFTARMAASFAFGGAVRAEQGQAWRLATLGDPLVTLGPGPGRIEGDAPLAGAKDIEDWTRDAATGERFQDAIVGLTYLGRDKDAARLAKGLLKERPRDVTPGVAIVSIMPLFRARDAEGIVGMFASLSREQAADGPRRDALWHACYNSLGSRRDQALLAALRLNLREDQLGKDAADLTIPVADALGRDEALGLIEQARSRARNDNDRYWVAEADKKLKTRPGVRK
ncbi:MAG: hypothetical protein ACKVW3_08735 [Phycisphaerales bacterium]